MYVPGSNSRSPVRVSDAPVSLSSTGSSFVNLLDLLPDAWSSSHTDVCSPSPRSEIPQTMILYNASSMSHSPQSQCRAASYSSRLSKSPPSSYVHSSTSSSLSAYRSCVSSSLRLSATPFSGSPNNPPPIRRDLPRTGDSNTPWLLRLAPPASELTAGTPMHVPASAASPPYGVSSNIVSDRAEGPLTYCGSRVPLPRSASRGTPWSRDVPIIFMRQPDLSPTPHPKYGLQLSLARRAH